MQTLNQSAWQPDVSDQQVLPVLQLLPSRHGGRELVAS